MLKVSIIIPVLNEEKFIEKCLKSILNQTYPCEFLEVICVDGISQDKTVDIIKKHCDLNNNIKLLFNEKHITPISMNMGIKASKGDVIIILGAHSYLDEHFVKKNVRNIIEKGVDCSGGPIESISTDFLSECIAKAMSCPFGVGNASFRYSKKEIYVDTLAFGAYKKEVFNNIGYFDEELIRNQDYEFNLRLTLNGGKILMSPDIKSYYYVRSSLKKLWNQYFQYGYWKVKVIKKHNKFTRLRHVIPSAFVLSIFFSILFSFINSIFLNVLFIIILLYFVLSIYFSFKISSNNKKSYFLLPVIFLILHFSYGIGFLKGIMRFIKDKK